MSISFIDETITEPQQASRWIYDKIAERKDEFGINFLGLDERLKPQYPAVMIISGERQKALHQTHIFLVAMQVLILVYHGRLDLTHTDRTLEDLELVTNIENWLERGSMNMDDKITFMYIRQTTPIIERNAQRYMNDNVIGTQMVVAIESRKGFPYGP